MNRSTNFSDIIALVCPRWVKDPIGLIFSIFGNSSKIKSGLNTAVFYDLHVTVLTIMGRPKMSSKKKITPHPNMQFCDIVNDAIQITSFCVNDVDQDIRFPCTI